jgi:uncharacterized protein (DUF58 family)
MNAGLRKYLGEGEQAAGRYSLGMPRQAPVNLAGSTLANRAGSSLEFKDHRVYEPGDDLRHIDWNAFARTDQLTIKLFREEMTPHLDVVVDSSRSMRLEDAEGAGSTKAGATVALAAFFAAAASRAGYSHAVWMIGDDCQPVANGNRSPLIWDGIDFEHVGSPGSRFPMWRPRGTRILISDLLWVGEPLMTLRPFAERSAVTVVLQLLAQADAEPPEGRSLRLVDAETGEIREIHVDAIAARRYRDALSRHQENWILACRQVGATFVQVVAEHLLRDWNLDALVAAEVLRVV